MSPSETLPNDVLHPVTHKLRYCKCGHTEPVHKTYRIINGNWVGYPSKCGGRTGNVASPYAPTKECECPEFQEQTEQQTYIPPRPTV